MAAPLSEITAIVREVLHDNDLELSDHTRFDELADWDSMDLVTVVVEVECRFNIQFELAEIDRLSTVGDLIHAIMLKRPLVAA